MGSTCSKDAAVAQQSRAANAAPLPATLAKTSSAQRIPDKIVSMAALAPKERVVRYEYPVKPQAALDVDIHVTYNGVCASDVHMIDNNWGMSRYPLVPGHEVVGRVIAVGNAVKDLKVGDVVGLGCLAQKCDHCEWCEKKLDNLCPQRKFTYFSTTVDETGEHVHHGGFSSFIRTDARGLFKIPDGYSEAHAGPLMCAGITVGAPLYEFCGNSFNGSGKRIAVVGLGGLGHLAVMFAVKMGAEVTVISRGESKRQFALELGAHRFIDSGNTEQMKAAAASVDLLLVCISGGKFDVMSYVGLMRPYGHIHLVGIPEEDLSLNIQAFVFQRLSLSGSPIGSSEQMRAMLAFAGKHNIKPIIEIFPHSRANEAIQKVRDNTIRFRAVLQNDLA